MSENNRLKNHLEFVETSLGDGKWTVVGRRGGEEVYRDEITFHNEGVARVFALNMQIAYHHGRKDMFEELDSECRAMREQLKVF